MTEQGDSYIGALGAIEATGGCIRDYWRYCHLRDGSLHGLVCRVLINREGLRAKRGLIQWRMSDADGISWVQTGPDTTKHVALAYDKLVERMRESGNKGYLRVSFNDWKSVHEFLTPKNAADAKAKALTESEPRLFKEPRFVKETHKLPHGFVLRTRATCLREGWTVEATLTWPSTQNTVWSGRVRRASSDRARDYIRQTVADFTKALGGTP